MNIALSVAFALLSVAFFLLARLMQENGKLRTSRRRTASVMRRLKRDRDAREQSYQAAVEVAKEELAKNDALVEELSAYWDEERERFGADAAARLN